MYDKEILGKVAYETWANLVSSPTIKWDELPSPAKAGWEEVALAVIDARKYAREESGWIH